MWIKFSSSKSFKKYGSNKFIYCFVVACLELQKLILNYESQIPNPKSLIRIIRSNKRRVAQPEMTAERPTTLETYIHSKTIRIPGDQRFDLKSNVLQLITTRLQFGGTSAENGLKHLTEFSSLFDDLKRGQFFINNKNESLSIHWEIWLKDGCCRYLQILSPPGRNWARLFHI